MSDDREHRIRDRAYALWEKDGGAHGHHDTHWQQATGEIDAEDEAIPADPPAPAKTARAPRTLKATKGDAAQNGIGKTKPEPPAAAAARDIDKITEKPAARPKRKSN